MSEIKFYAIPNDLENYYPGSTCECYAKAEFECACESDWTPKEVYRLRDEVNNLYKRIEQLEKTEKEVVDLSHPNIKKIMNDLHKVETQSEHYRHEAETRAKTEDAQRMTINRQKEAIAILEQAIGFANHLLALGITGYREKKGTAEECLLENVNRATKGE